jgi:hypothetical protein
MKNPWRESTPGGVAKDFTNLEYGVKNGLEYGFGLENVVYPQFFQWFIIIFP